MCYFGDVVFEFGDVFKDEIVDILAKQLADTTITDCEIRYRSCGHGDLSRTAVFIVYY